MSTWGRGEAVTLKTKGVLLKGFETVDSVEETVSEELSSFGSSSLADSAIST